MNKTISVITPCYNEELNVRDCYEAIRQIFDSKLQGYRREHIFCDNASSDGTLDILRDIARQDPHVRVIVNARNFGPLRNTYNGVMASTGDAVLLFGPRSGSKTRHFAIPDTLPPGELQALLPIRVAQVASLRPGLVHPVAGAVARTAPPRRWILEV